MYNPKTRVHLIDTPGFDDTTHAEMDILKEIADYMNRAARSKTLLSGIIYFHDLSVSSAILESLSLRKSKYRARECEVRTYVTLPCSRNHAARTVSTL